MIEKILDKNNIAYKVIDGEGNTTIIKINGKLHMLYIHTRQKHFDIGDSSPVTERKLRRH